MSLTHPYSAGRSARSGGLDTDISASRREVVTQEARALRAMPLTRRYEMRWLSPSGEIEDTVRLAPATPLFEEAFSALARGTVILTDTGPVAVEDLQPGMRALTAEGTVATVTWIGSMAVYPGIGTEMGSPVRLTRVVTEAFGQGRPLPDLVLGNHARLLQRDPRLQRLLGTDIAYIPAAAFADGVSVFGVTPSMPVTVFHLVLEHHGSLRIGGLEVESYHPGEDAAERLGPRMAALFLAMFPHLRALTDFGPLAHPRVNGDLALDLLG